jgi:[ribosomal protein S5]-alanine N-acetyltransferase
VRDHPFFPPAQAGKFRSAGRARASTAEDSAERCIGRAPDTMTASDKFDSLPAVLLGLFHRMARQPVAIRHNPLQAMSKEGIANMLESEGSDLSQWRKYETYRWFVECDGATVGSVGLKNISHTMGYGEIGYGIGEAYQGKGIATSAVGLLVGMCFRESPLRKLLAYVHDTKLASCKVLQKLGFTQEGLLREHYIINGVPENELLFGLLKREWKQIAPRTGWQHPSVGLFP